MRNLAPAISLLICLLMSNGAALAAEEPCAATLNANCQACHSKARICQSLEKKNKGAWQRTIKNMIRKGARLSEAEGASLADCLASAPTGADFVCK